MKGPKLFVTGGAGFIGSEYVRQEAAGRRYSKIYVLDKLTYAGNIKRIELEIENEKVEFIHADVKDTTLYAKAISECNEVVHFAAESHVDRSIEDGSVFLNTNVIGTYNLLEITRYQKNCRTLLVSTDEVYGSTKDLAEFDENSDLAPSSNYSASKAASDLFALANFKTFKQNLVITRCTNNYGPFQDPEKFLPVVINSFLLKKCIPVYGSGKNVREWIHISDHCDAVRKVLKNGNAGEIYNIGTGHRLSNLDLIAEVAHILKKVPEIEFVVDRKGHDFRYALNSEKVKNKMNWTPKVSLREGLKETLDWYSKNSWVFEK
jgi:dTDP-glucose 4,6-dehydratase